MSIDTLHYLEQRLDESNYDLYETVTSIQKIRLAKLIDILLFSTGVVFFVTYTIQNQLIPNIFVFVSVVLFIALYVFLRALLKGQSAGYILMGIRFVNVRSKREVSLKEYLNYIRKSTRMEVRYTEIVRYYLDYSGRLNQNQPMRRFGMILVDAPRYKRFYNEYSSIKQRYEELVQQQA